jgi:hypothetical protein
VIAQLNDVQHIHGAITGHITAIGHGTVRIAGRTLSAEKYVINQIGCVQGVDGSVGVYVPLMRTMALRGSVRRPRGTGTHRHYYQCDNEKTRESLGTLLLTFARSVMTAAHIDNYP